MIGFKDIRQTATGMVHKRELGLSVSRHNRIRTRWPLALGTVNRSLTFTLRKRSSRPMPKMFCLLFLLLASNLGAQGTLLTSVAPGEIEIENCARVNDRGVQFGPALYGEELVFVARPKRGNINPATRMTFFKLFSSLLSRDGLPANPKRFRGALDGNFNEGPVSFTQEDRVIFFTRTLQTDGATVEDVAGRANLGIYSAYRGQYDWEGIRPLPFNGPDFSNQHPTVTANGKRVFFASNRPGGYGGFDLYFSDKRDGIWSPAINLGPEINTEGNEAFPFIHQDGQLFFASDGHGGLGGYDLFLMDLSQRRWGELINLPAPVNSPADDVGITLSADARRAYLVSNRDGGMGDDDIYLLRLKNGLASLRGPETDGETFTLIDRATSRRLAGARVWFTEVGPAGRLPASMYSFGLSEGPAGRQIQPRLKPINQLPSTNLRTGPDGTIRLDLTVGKTYELTVHRENYEPQQLRFIYEESGPSRPLVMTLSPVSCRLVAGKVTDIKGGGIEAVPVQFRPENCRAASVSTVTDLTGSYELCVPAACGYLVVAGRPGYETGTVRIEPGRLGESARPLVDLALRAEGNVSRRGRSAVDAVLPLPGINFFANTAILQEGRSGDIGVLYNLLTDRPDLKLLLAAHTDGTQTAAELVSLGEKRVVTVRDALLRMGIAGNRVRTIAYGNTRRLKPCGSCTAADYAANNRLEARVIEW